VGINDGNRFAGIIGTDAALAISQPYSVRLQPILRNHGNGYQTEGFEALSQLKAAPYLSPEIYLNHVNISEHDLEMLRQACVFSASLAGLGDKRPYISVNFAAQSLAQVGLADRIANTLLEHGVDAKHIKVEMLEHSHTPSGVMTVSDNVHKLSHEFGVNVFADDYGTGATDNVRIKTFNLSHVKIDKSLANKDGIASIRANPLLDDKHLIFEGIENKDQLRLIEPFKNKSVQGFLFHRPMGVEQAKSIAYRTHAPNNHGLYNNVLTPSS
jgi:EAL domain-containing protein (putative c-di-GMP-specific phosphodiesterase class I)